MQLILETSIAARETVRGRDVPTVVDLLCPFCRRDLSFTLEYTEEANATRGMPLISRCPRCSQLVTFVSLPDRQGNRNTELFVHPSPKARTPVPVEELDALPDGLKGAYGSAVRVYSAGEWRAAAALSRTVLEGLVKTLMPDENTRKRRRHLAESLRLLPQRVDLKLPLTEIADVVREGGSFAGYLELERDPDEAIATDMMDLMDVLIEYLLLLPGRVDRIHTRIMKDDASTGLM